MSEITALALRHLMRPSITRIAVVVSLMAAPIMMRWGPGGRTFPFASSAALFASMWTALAFMMTMRVLLFRQGSSLIPRYRVRTLLIALSLALIVALLPSLAALMVGSSPLTIIALSIFCFAVMWSIGPIIPDNQKIGLSLLSFALVIDMAIYSGRARAELNYWLDFVDPLWQKLALIVLAALLIAWSSYRMVHLRDDAWVLRRWWTRLSGDCMECGGQTAMPYFILAAMPNFARRRMPVRDNGHTIEGRLQTSLFRYSTNALGPAGLVLVYLPFVALITWLGLRDNEESNLFWNPNLLLLNGLIIWFGALTPSRLRRELLRPASRRGLMETMVAALRTDVIQFTVLFVIMSLSIHALLIRSAMARPEFWMGYLTAPGLVCFAFGVAMVTSKRTRWGGLVGFFPAWILAVIAHSISADDASTLTLISTFGASLVLAGLGVALSRRGQRAWEQIELG
jgi:hypothetical protein